MLTSAVYDDDTVQIPRSTTVTATRRPASKPGAGRAARYVSGVMPVMAKNQHRAEFGKNTAPSKSIPLSSKAAELNRPMTESESIEAAMNGIQDTWQEQQAHMATQTKMPFKPGQNKPGAVPDKPLPPSYTCHRCGQKGHWIQACPTNNDPSYDGRPKIRKTAGIPKSMLTVINIEDFDAVGENGVVDFSKLPAGVMQDNDGRYVMPKPDKEAWDKFQEKTQAAAEKQKEVNAGDQMLRDRGLECPIDKRVFVAPVKTPCCGKTYCRDCIENALLDNDLVCPSCSTENIQIEALEADDETLNKVHAYENEKRADQKDRAASKSPKADNASAAGVATPKEETAKSPKGGPEITINGAESAASTPQSTKSNPLKRPADSEPANGRSAKIPKGPAAMQKQTSQTPAPVAVPKNMEEFAKQMNAMAQTMGGGNPSMPAFNNPMMMPGMGGMGMPGMGMPGMGMPPMGMNPAMMNPMMMQPGFGMGFPNQQRNMYGGSGMMPNAGYGQQGWQQGWNANGMSMQNGMGNFPNQMRAGTNTPNANDDDAYFRKPVNPHRHQGRQRRQRSVDYREM